MAGQTTGNIPLCALNPKYLYSNSTSHSWPFGAFAELIDNAYDPDVSAKQLWIDRTQVKDVECLVFMDNGTGMEYDKMHKMLSFGYSEKKAVKSHVPVGYYGNGFKSGSMRLGKDVIVFSKHKNSMTVGLLSRSYLEAIQAQHVMVPIVTFSQAGGDKYILSYAVAAHEDSLKVILEHSPFRTEAELLCELEAINATHPKGSTGTRIIIWNLHSTSRGQSEFDFETDRYDIRIPRINWSDVQGGLDPILESDPKSTYSLRAYCSILYLRPRMQINIRGLKVRTQLISKSLAHTFKDRYTPKFLKKHISITFGYNKKNKEQYGIMMYHKKRLIRAYEHVGCQLKDFNDTEEYRKIKVNLGTKLEEYWKEIRYKKRKDDPNCSTAIEDTERTPDQNWVQCVTCQKWRKLPDGIDAKKLPEAWFCQMNPDPQYRTCQAEEELEDSEDEQPFQRTYKQQEKNMKLQERNRRQSSDDPIPSPSTSNTPSTRVTRQTAGQVETCFTPPASATPSSGRRVSTPHRLLISDVRSLSTPRGKRTLFPNMQSKVAKRARVSSPQHSTAVVGDSAESSDPSSPSSHITPDNDDMLLAEMPAEHCVIEGVGTNLEASNEAFGEGSMETDTTVMAVSTPSCVQQQVSRTTQTELLVELKEEWEERMTGTSMAEDESMRVVERENAGTGDRAQTDRAAANISLLETQQDQLMELMQTAALERDQFREQAESARQERDRYREQVETANQKRDQYKKQVETANEERDRYREQVVTVSQERDGYREQVETANQGRDQYREQVEAANQERDRYKSELDQLSCQMDDLKEQLQELRASTVKKELCHQATETNGEDELALQVDSILRDLEHNNQERNELRSQLQSVEAERASLSSQCEQQRRELEEQSRELEELKREAGNRTSSPSTEAGTPNRPIMQGNPDDTHRLTNLRVSVSRLLVTLIPDLDLGQVNYDTNVIDEILEQFLDGVSPST
ncbi:hypothetical protein AGOR_G00217970 [Albula goreensis]|uniref:CW-type domain-containing protein n=1 Tax=Albula goreensis TaxID=1534307 RepID=A0A8T3CPM2_9TELE|nr:hypothetical protein AGOR_G00217970 [Albula goreensis]